MIRTDTISNLLSSIKNGYISKKNKITQINSNQTRSLLNILIQNGFLRTYQIKKNNKIDIFLRYKQNQIVLDKIKKISKPSKRIYFKNKNLYKNKTGMYILSTSKGILTDIQAKKFNVGGEVICIIY